MSSTFAASMVLLILLYGNCWCNATENAELCYRRCGIHNITSPFRLQDSPDTCGDKRYNLSCENNQLVLYLEFGKYNVKSINSNNYTIRVADVNVGAHDYSSLPRYGLTLNNFSDDDEPYQAYQYWIGYVGTLNSFSAFMKRSLVKLMLYLRCPNRVDSCDLYVGENVSCMNGNSYARGSTFYANVEGKSLWDLGLKDSCRVEFTYLTSWPKKDTPGNVSCIEIHEMLFHGFELSWLNSLSHEDSFVGFNRRGQLRYDLRTEERNPRVWKIVDILDELSIFTEIVVLISGARFAIAAPCVSVILIYKWRRRHLSMYDTIEYYLQSDNNIMPIRYSYKDIKWITGQFSTKLGSGGYGSVFKGQLRSGRFVAVKILDKTKETNGQDFINEVVTIGRIHHINVVQLIGFCVEGSKRALIYEFMSNGSLDKFIFSREESSSLSCEKLYAISLGVARGIEYLHNGCNMKILHFDIKPHNILLDENFNPKVSDFGLARLCPIDNSIVSLTVARGTIGYMAPELFYRNVGTISYKADVYSFGMLLMEMASRRKNLNAMAEESSQIYFPFWVYDRLQDEREITIENDTEEEIKLAKKMMIVALWCIQTKPSDRPSMDKVLEMLEKDEELQMPNKPYLYPQDLPAEDIRGLGSSGPSSDMSIRDSK
ncbi:rust resistance kinase Lr10-like [Abrus precatorius]|uniref:Rust resistance kinase Lr10-like n=1 Tax=Abrus precatorius TaxID=3816 RepID=A0A8B8K0K6_ABRPR|nr:rust resistance kinase Lr10-like [Abrus precatorius]